MARRYTWREGEEGERGEQRNYKTLNVLDLLMSINKTVPAGLSNKEEMRLEGAGNLR